MRSFSVASSAMGEALSRLACLWNRLSRSRRDWLGQGASQVSASPAVVNVPAPWLGGLLLVSLLTVLNIQLIFTVMVGMDQYGFYALEMTSSWPLPLALSALVNTASALVGYFTYGWLWRRQSRFIGGSWGAFSRNAAIVTIPTAMALGPAILSPTTGRCPTTWLSEAWSRVRCASLVRFETARCSSVALRRITGSSSLPPSF